MNSKIPALLVCFLTFNMATAQQLLWFGTATTDGHVMQCRFEVLREGEIKTIVLAPYGVTPTTFQNVKESKGLLTFTWIHNQSDQSPYLCALRKVNEFAYEGDCSCEGKSITHLTIRDFTKEDAFLQGDSLRSSQTDLKILERALELLGNGKSWNKVDNRICDGGSYPYQWSLFCALHQSSIEITFEYRHLRSAIQATRQAINEFSGGKKYAHLLQDFNNEATDFQAIEKVLERAREIVKERIVSHR
jgi:hypothetical protein